MEFSDTDTPEVNNSNEKEISMALTVGKQIPINPVLSKYLGGTDANMFLQTIHYHLCSEFTKGHIDKDGVKWIYNTQAQWCEMLHISLAVLKRIIKTLNSLGLIHTEQFNLYRRESTLFYRINYPRYAELCSEWGIELSASVLAQLLNAPIPSSGKVNSTSSISRIYTSLKHSLLPKTSPKDKQQEISTEGCGKPVEKSVVFYKKKFKKIEEKTKAEYTLPECLLAQLTALVQDEEFAWSLIHQYSPQNVSDQLRWLPFRKAHNPAGYLVKALAAGWGPNKAAIENDEKCQKKEESLEKETVPENALQNFLKKMKEAPVLFNPQGAKLTFESVRGSYVNFRDAQGMCGSLLLSKVLSWPSVGQLNAT